MAQIQSGASADLLTIGATNKAARVELYDAAGNPLLYAQSAQPAAPAGILAMAMNDGIVIPNRCDRFGSQAIAMNQPLLHESFEGTVTSPVRWLITATTMAAAQTTIGGIVINSGNITTINTGYMLKSTRLITKMQRQPLQFKCRAKLNRQNNSVMELGFGDAATFNGVNTTGAYFQVAANGNVQPVVTFNSVDRTGSAITLANPTLDWYTFDILVDDDEAVFVVQDTATGNIVSRQSIPMPITGARLWSATQVGTLIRLYNTGVAPASAPQLTVSDVYIAALDSNMNMTLGEMASANGRSSLEHPFTGVQAQTFTNSAAPANATLSNTAAGYATLGGLFSFAAVAGAATDYALFGYQVPANFQIAEIEIEAWNTGAAVATTPTLLVWGLATQLTAVSLATAAHLRYALGTQSFPIGAAPGANAQRIVKTFQTPVFCAAGRFIDIILRMPVATATASQVVQGHVSIGGKYL